MRQTLDNAGKQEVWLGEELEWLELYLKLQQIRFSDRLRFSIDAAPETLDAMVPNLILSRWLRMRSVTAWRLAPRQDRFRYRPGYWTVAG